MFSKISTSVDLADFHFKILKHNNFGSVYTPFSTLLGSFYNPNWMHSLHFSFTQVQCGLRAL